MLYVCLVNVLFHLVPEQNHKYNTVGGGGPEPMGPRTWKSSGILVYYEYLNPKYYKLQNNIIQYIIGIKFSSSSKVIWIYSI